MEDFDPNRYSVSIHDLFDAWKNKSNSYGIDHKNNKFIPDGIVDPSSWGINGSKKILFILKEAYGDDWGDSTLTSWLHTYPKRRIWDRVARVVYGIQNTNESQIQRYKAVLSEDEFRTAINQIAVLNLKKSNGKNQSDSEEIAEYAAFDRDEIKRELNLIDADIIVCGNTFQILCEEVFQQTIPSKDKCDNWYYHINIGEKEKLFIDYYHPAIHDSDLLFYYGVVGIYQQSLLAQHKVPFSVKYDCDDNPHNIDGAIFDFAYDMAFRDATMRNAFRKDGTEENLADIKERLSTNFKPIVREYIDLIFADQHPLPIEYIRRISSDNACELNMNGRFTFGNAQKLVNMTAKYMFLSCYNNEEMRKLFDKCDCPMDGYMIKMIDKNTDYDFDCNNAWSGITCSNHGPYDYFQDQIRAKCIEGIIPLEYDFLNWNN